MAASDYIKWLRGKVGHEPVILNATNAIIVNDEGEVLFMQRGDFTHDVLWGLPGGMMEIDESAEEAVVREAREETGLEIKVEEFLGAYTNNEIVSYPNGDECKIILFVFVCTASGKPTADGVESLQLKYFTPDAPPKLFRAYTYTVLSDYISGKRGFIR